MASIDKRPNGQWRARWREFPSGPQKTKQFDRKVDAERFLVKIQASQLDGSYTDPSKGRTTVREFYRVWASRQQWRDGTRASVASRFDNNVLPTFGDRPLGTIRRGDVESWVAGIKLAPGTVGLALQQFSAMLEAAVVDGLIGRNPAKGIKRPRRQGEPVTPYTAHEVDRLLEAAEPWFRVAIILGVRAGLRQGEATGLAEDRIPFLQRQLKVDRQLVTVRGTRQTVFGPPKTANSYRTVPLADSTVTALAAHLSVFGTGRDGVLLHRDGQPIDAVTFGQQWRKTRARAKLPERARFHDTRHTFASTLLSSGVSVAAVAEYLGDTPAVVLNTYAHLMPADHDRARAAIEAAFMAEGREARAQVLGDHVRS